MNQQTYIPQEQDAELNVQIRQLQSKIRLFQTLFFVLIVVGFAICFLGAIIPGVIVAIIGGIMTVPRAKQEAKLKLLVSGNIVQQALEDVFDDITYQAGGRLPDHYVRGNALGLSGFDRIEGSDYVKGTYKGLNIEMSDVTLVKEEVEYDEDGNREEKEYTVFKGLWLVCDFGKELSADLQVWERGKIGKLLSRSGIKTENEKFNKHFFIASAIEQEAFYILTPHMMEYILEMDKKAGGETHMHFARNGKVQIAIHSGRDAFEVKRGERDAARLRQKFVQEIRYVTDIIDELRLVDTLYKK